MWRKYGIQLTPDLLFVCSCVLIYTLEEKIKHSKNMSILIQHFFSTLNLVETAAITYSSLVK